MRKVCLIMLSLLLTAGLAAAAPVVNQIWPNSGLNRQTVTVQVFGRDYATLPPDVWLGRTGFPDIEASETFVNDSLLSCSFDLTGASTGLYDLIVYSPFGWDTLKGCFSIYSISYSPVTWIESTVGAGEWYMSGVALGDGDGDGELEVYGACHDDSLYQFKWDGATFNKTLVGYATWSFNGVVVGDGNDDKDLDVYAASSDGVIYQFQWDGMSWTADTVGESWEGVSSVALGDGNNDGIVDVYGASLDDTLYQYTWDGMLWQQDMIGFGGDDLLGVAVGDGDNDGVIEVYTACQDNNVYRFNWLAGWQRDTVGTGSGGMLGVALGDGDNDGDVEVYGACSDNNVYQFKWDGMAWGQTTVGSAGDWMHGVVVADGNGDGEFEVYASSYDSTLYEFKWNGVSWLVDTVGAGGDSMLGVAVGDGNNDGKMEVYGANWDFSVYQYAPIKLPDIDLSDTVYDFGFVLVGDSSDWTDLAVRNAGTADLVVGGILSSNPVFTIVSPSLPDTIPTEDSLLATVRFKPVSIGAEAGTLSVFSNDPDESPVRIAVAGQGHSGPNIELSDSTYDFGPVVVGDSLDWTSLIISNIGVGPLSVDSLVPDNVAYQALGITLPDTLQPGDSTFATVRFKPDVDDTITATLYVYSDDLTSPAIPVSLSGVGLDATPPVPFSLTSPADLSVLAEVRPTFIWQPSSDALSGLRDYELYIDSVLAQTTIDTLWMVDFDLTEIWHDWYVIAHDSAGNPQQSNETWTFAVDVSAPVIESTTVWTDTSFAGPFEILTKVTDNLAGVDSVKLFYKRDEDPDWVSSMMLASGPADWYLDSIPQVFISEDTVRYYIEAADGVVPTNVGTDPVGAPGAFYWFVASVVGVEEIRAVPGSYSFKLKSNPARGVVMFDLFAPAAGEFSLRIYDISGRLVDEPMAGKKPGGVYQIHSRPDLSSGIYFYRFESPWRTESGKLVLVR